MSMAFSDAPVVRGGLSMDLALTVLERGQGWMRRPPLKAGSFLVVALFAAPAAAQTCLFPTECFDTEACVEGGWEVTLGGDVLSTDFGDLAVVGRAGGSVMAEGMGMVVMLTPDAEDARASVHMDGTMVNYAGACAAPDEEAD